MNYIYDILVNYQPNLYDFFEWNVEDNITHIRKTPLYKIETRVLSDLKNKYVIFESDLLLKIKNKTETFNESDFKKIKYSLLFSDGNEVISLKLCENGKVNGISKLMVDEESEVLEMTETVNIKTISYSVIGNRNSNDFKTRNEIYLQKYINKQLVKIEQQNDFEKLKYLYYECFNKKETDKETIIYNIKKELKLNFDILGNKLYNFFKLTSLNK